MHMRCLKVLLSAGWLGAVVLALQAGMTDDDMRGWREKREREWYVSESSMLPRPAQYNKAFFSSALAVVPERWVYTNEAGVWLPCLDAIVKEAPKPLPAIFWTSMANPTCWVGYVRLAYTGPAQTAGRLFSPWRCLRVNGMWRAETVGIPASGTNIFMTYLPHLRTPEDTNDVMLFIDSDNVTNDIPVTLTAGTDVSGMAQRVNARRAVRWRRVAAQGESPEGVYWVVGEHALVCAHRTWWSPVAQEAVLRVGCDDAVRVWHNNRVVFETAQRSGYVREEHGVRVRLERGENHFMFVLVNGGGPAQLGARLYPSVAPIEGGLVLNDVRAYHSGQVFYGGEPASEVHRVAERTLDFLWLPVTNFAAPDAVRHIDPGVDCWRPQPMIAPWKPVCQNVRVSRLRDGMTIFAATNVTAYPLRVDMRNQPSGMYRCEARWGGSTHARSFYHGNALEGLDATQRLWLHFAQTENFFEPSMFCNMLAKSFRDAPSSATGVTYTVRAFVSSRDGTIQPYLLRIPEQLASATGAPMIVQLKIALPMSMEDWCSDAMRRQEGVAGQDRAIVIIPYARGARVYSGLAEGDVLDAIADALRVTGADRERVYLVGDSLGGHGCWLIGARHPDMFAALMPRSGYDASGWRNLLALPLWQVHGELDAPEQVQQLIAVMQANGADAHVTVESGKLHTEMNGGTLEQTTAWMLSKRLARAPQRVVYGTYGDVDGAYWVRGIVPQRYGMEALVDARWSVSGATGTIAVHTHNVNSLTLDLRADTFSTCGLWQVVIDGTNFLDICGGSVSTIDVARQVKGATVRAGKRKLCGGLASVVDYGFLFAYSGADSTHAAANTADALRASMMGRATWRFDSVFQLVEDKDLTAALCASNNVILCATAAAPGAFLTRDAAALPFSLTSDRIAIGGRTGTQMVCLYPNPMATNRYLLVVMSTKFTARLLQTARCDVLLDGMSGSFDAAWRNVVWDDEPADREFGNKHEANHAAATPARVAEQARAYRLRSWLRQLPWGWIVPIVWLALMIGWGVARVRRGRR